LERGLQRPIVALPEHHTIQARLGSQTRHVGALDGSDQQLFAYVAHPDYGVGIWGRLYTEIDVQQGGAETYRDGPISAGAWSAEELLMYHHTITLPDRQTTMRWRNDLHAIRQVLSNTRVTDPPIFSKLPERIAVRAEAARERATGEWLALGAAVIHQLAPDDLLLKDGRFNCQMEMSASWVDQLGRRAARNGVRLVAVVKSGMLYQEVYPIVQEIASITNRAFWFVVPATLIQDAYANDKYPERKTLMLGGRDEKDLAGIGALWTAFCPDPANFRTFAIIEFNLYNLHHYRALARTPLSLRQWHTEIIGGQSQHSQSGQVKGRVIPRVEVTDVAIHADHDMSQLVEPTLAELLWLCEQEVAHFGYPNLLGLAHRDVVLTKRKVDQLRKRFREILADSDRILDELVDQQFIETPHKFHNIE